MADIIAEQGDIPKAFALWQQSLEIKEQIGDVKGKSNTLNNMAHIIAEQGDIPKAFTLWQESLEISEQIGDVKSKAATLSNMARIIAAQGDTPKALLLYEQSLKLQQKIGDVKGKAITLSNMAGAIAKQGDIPNAIIFYKQVVATLAQIRAYGVLVTVLYNLSTTDKSKGLIYLAQAMWLTLRISESLVSTINLIHALYNAVAQGDELKALLGATAIFFCVSRGEGHPQLEELRKHSLKMISDAAARQGIETQEAFDAWSVQQRLNDPQYFIRRLDQHLEQVVGNGWLFDPNQVSIGE